MAGQENTIGKYRYIEQIGRGGFATVYRAKNIKLGNEVVLKIMDSVLAEDENFVRRFEHEAQEMVQLDHPNIVRITDLDKIENKLFIVMEYVPGKNLRDVIQQEGLLPLEKVVTIISQIGKALDYAYTRKLIHRDVKPANILIRDDGVAKLTDFGIAKALESTQMTRTGTMLGTPAYMSPEQTRGVPLDGRSDLYSLGVVLFELVTGKPPFEGDTASMLYKQVHEAPPTPSQIATRAKGPLEPILIKALAKNPDERYQTGSELATALENAIKELQQTVLTNMYGQTMVLMRERKYTEALKELESLNAMQPGYQNIGQLIDHARKGIKLVELYQKAGHHVAEARKLAEQITNEDPNFPDPDNVLQAVNRVSAIDWQRVFTWIGSAVVLTTYLTTSWIWIARFETSVTADGTTTTTAVPGSGEGLTMLLNLENSWGMWLPFLTVLLMLVFTVIQRTQNGRALQILTGAKWIILLVGLVSAVAVYISGFITNVTSMMVIIGGLLLMLLVEVLPVIQSMRGQRKVINTR